jgi:hypothetical protein
MASDDGAIAAATSIIQSLATGPHSAKIVLRDSNGLVDLPGPDTLVKKALEQEIGSLISRIHALEKAAGSSQITPDTPNEFAVSSPFGGMKPITHKQGHEADLQQIPLLQNHQNLPPDNNS